VSAALPGALAAFDLAQIHLLDGIKFRLCCFDLAAFALDAKKILLAVFNFNI